MVITLLFTLFLYVVRLARNMILDVRYTINTFH
jgi:hypothetical protein